MTDVEFRIGDQWSTGEPSLDEAARDDMASAWRAYFENRGPRLPNRVYESMTKVEVNGYTVRVWRDEKSLEPASTDDLRSALEAAPIDATRPDLVAIAEAFPRVVAVEVLDAKGNGVLLYPDWS